MDTTGKNMATDAEDSATADQLNEVLLARQPIFDQKMKVYAYELLFRSGSAASTANVIDGDEATTSLVLNTYSEIGFEQVVGNKLAFINLTENLIKNPLPITKDKVVLEILEDVEISDELITAVQFLANHGFKIALDDFEYHEKWNPLIECADIIKIDLLAMSEEELRKHIEILKPMEVKLLAEKIETYEQLELCKELGFDYFQGYFLSKPKIIKGKKISPNKLVVLRLLAALNDRGIQMNELEKILSEDPRLTYKILKIINSAAYNKLSKIDSVKQAIVFLGLDKLKEWATIIALSSVEGKPDELMINTLIRAKMTELLGQQVEDNEADLYFFSGLFSNLDAIMDQDIHELLDEMPISDKVKKAVVDHEGKMGEVLSDVIAYEHGNWNLLKCDLEPAVYTEAYLASINWANTTTETLKD